VVVYGAWIAALATLAGLWLGAGIGLAAAVVLPVVAFVGLAAFEREASVLRLVRAFLASRRTPRRALDSHPTFDLVNAPAARVLRDALR